MREIKKNERDNKANEKDKKYKIRRIKDTSD